MKTSSFNPGALKRVCYAAAYAAGSSELFGRPSAMPRAGTASTTVVGSPGRLAAGSCPPVASTAPHAPLGHSAPRTMGSLLNVIQSARSALGAEGTRKMHEELGITVRSVRPIARYDMPGGTGPSVSTSVLCSAGTERLGDVRDRQSRGSRPKRCASECDRRAAMR